ncbi:MAG: RidA family protein [Alphaproteobacteria bacterium]|nr:RidA family protein [Alphaproteobacteria bacterium]
MIKRLTPGNIHPPLARYAHATEVPPGARWLVLSGQLGIAADGSIPPDVESQATVCFENIVAILREASMDVSNLVRLTTYLTDEADLAAYMKIRDRFVVDPPPASTLLVVRSFSKKQFLVEIEAVAAKVSADP